MMDLGVPDFPLEGCALIEASAGTGKTYTISTLYLRLLLGHGASKTSPPRPRMPPEILVMTFTRAATQELRDRIRRRVQETLAILEDRVQDPDPQLAAILAGHSPDDWPELARRLRLAADSMDDAAIFTIDAWCQRVLHEHALLAGWDPRQKLLPDFPDLAREAAEDFWRQNVYVLPEEDAEWLLRFFRDPDALQQAIGRLAENSPGTASSPDWRDRLQNLRTEADRVRAAWNPHHAAHVQWLESVLARDPYPLNLKSAKPDRLQDLIRKVDRWRQDPARLYPEGELQDFARLGTHLATLYKKQHEPDLPETSAEWDRILEGCIHLRNQETGLRNAFLMQAGQRIRDRLEVLKQEEGVMNFSDVQDRLLEALQGPVGNVLASRIRERYPAAMVDEFQDSSARQYAIFDAIYRVADPFPETLLLFIGDPKQSIYRFRGADIHSYLQAKNHTTGHQYVLGTNYRSSCGLVDALNALYEYAEKNGQRGAFAFAPTPEGASPLPFHPVRAHGQKNAWIAGGTEGKPVTFWQAPREMAKTEYVQHFALLTASSISAMLQDHKTGFQTETGWRRLEPGDISILVRQHQEGVIMEQALRRLGLPAVILGERRSIYQGAEAQELLCWLEAAAMPLDQRRLRVALAQRHFGLEIRALHHLLEDEIAWEQQQDRFLRYRELWERHGILAMLQRSLHDESVPARLLARPGGERILGNLLHLGELLQKASVENASIEALLAHFRQSIENGGGKGEEEDVTLRLESDAQRIRISTIHAAKGLQYPLVFLPFIAGVREEPGPVAAQAGTGRDPRDPAPAGPDLERLQEDLRLLYVALTRAEHALWLGLAEPEARKKSRLWHGSAIAHLLRGEGRSLADCLAHWSSHSRIHIAAPAITPSPGRIEPERRKPSIAIPFYHGQFDRDWTICSYSSLARIRKGGEPAVPETAGSPASAPWHRFPRGPAPGIFLHALLQWLARHGFSALTSQTMASAFREQTVQLGWGEWQEPLLVWFQKIVGVPLPGEIPFSRITRYQTEMGFWFPLHHANSEALDRLCLQHLIPGKRRPEATMQVLNGLMRGFMDLVFEMDGRYYVLDYKSSTLGPDDTCYQESALREDTLSHRYDLQMAIYQLALHRHLRQRLGTGYDPERHLGGGLIFYLRGCSGPASGILHLPAGPELVLALDHTFGDALEPA